MDAIRVNSLKKKFKKITALDDVSLSVEEGELFGLLGVNGAGKTTLINILSGLCKKNEGKVHIFDFDIDKNLNEIKKIIDISPQETSVAPNLTVKENLKFFASIYDVKEDKIDSIISTFKLNEVINQKAKTLSGGWQRRLSIAIALVSSPKILFLDEPTLGLDVLARRDLWKIILSLKGKITIILTSHYLEEIEALCDKFAILSKGKLLKIGTIEEIKKNVNNKSFEDAFVEIVEENQ